MTSLLSSASARAETEKSISAPAARIVVTGATGFIGRRLVVVLRERGHAVVEAGRRPGGGDPSSVHVGEIGAATDWREALSGADAVVHLAGLAHRDTGAGDDDAYFEINDRGTERLTKAAEEAGIRAMVLVSSIFAKLAEVRPSAYARSKLLSEAHVLRLNEHSGQTGIVLRPSLVYAHNAAANWRRLQRLAATGLPLPFGAIRNRRSLCAVENLCSAIVASVEAGLRGEGGGSYEIADEEIVSLADIIAYLREGMGMSKRLVPVAPSALEFVARLAGKSHVAATLFSDIVVDPADFIKTFDWRPPVTTPEGVARSGREFIAARRAGA
ncbi:NAD-dependent epimerase/dehydratase family protein [Aquamicrobium sp. LC103]|uniref:NAD-dependent epimerase/dehydratase family protein n=1 Tax=Aquamicrobium sp. LC103 TaxID=1120658 RepID=UPI00069C6385|nr:NAD-dependent epimerase/dehydratase family protein [Aquamicrobium sp. LC103]TKT75385.1 NAD-dependent epimerase/dehydratase family protein [Aquamicrobium sp. LC103]